MQFYGDYHTHTFHSDGRSSVEENVIMAKSKGFVDVAITDHGYRSLCMSAKDYDKIFIDVEKARKAHPDINILFGIENTIIDGDGLIDLPPTRLDDFDILIVGFHFPVKIPSYSAFRNFWLPALLHGGSNKPTQSLINLNTKAFIKMLQKYPIDILAHIGYYMPINAEEVAKCCADLGTYIELNSKHLPECENLIESMLKTDVKFIANSDSHHYTTVGNFSETEKLIEKYGMADRVANLQQDIYLRSKGRNIIRPTVSSYKLNK